MNAQQNEVQQTTKKLKSNTAEMAMLMAIALKLEQKVQVIIFQLLARKSDD